MDAMQPLRCPHCNALVVDRRSPVCTTCRQELPKEWVMSAKQAAKVQQIDAQSRAQFMQEMRTLDPSLDPNVPAIVKILDSDASGYGF
jgi:hypothetical protein